MWVTYLTFLSKLKQGCEDLKISKMNTSETFGSGTLLKKMMTLNGKFNRFSFTMEDDEELFTEEQTSEDKSKKKKKKKKKFDGHKFENIHTSAHQ